MDMRHPTSLASGVHLARHAVGHHPLQDVASVEEGAVHRLPGVDRFVEVARARGAEVLHEPKEWWYAPGYYGGFVRDPDGNNVEAHLGGAEGPR